MSETFLVIALIAVFLGLGAAFGSIAAEADAVRETCGECTERGDVCGSYTCTVKGWRK